MKREYFFNFIKNQIRMRLIFTLYTCLFTFLSCLGQSGFQFENNKSKITIPFQLINNLIFIPIKVNGEELTFMLDTGVEETVLFSLEDKKEVSLFHLESIKLKGLGSKEAIDAFKSSKNKLEVNGFADLEHDIYIVTDQEFNFSSQVGIPVNGIIGYQFFKDHLVEINYESKKITVYNSTYMKIRKKLRRNFHSDSISLELNKPYCISNVQTGAKNIPSKMLIDTGNSDAIWLFLNQSKNIQLPEKTIPDFLGRGFSGEIHGLRGRIANFSFAGKIFKNSIGTFPDSGSLKSVNFVPNRIGSIGGEVLSRFSIVFDYPNRRMYTRPNEKINDPFHFNMSGIEVAHAGLEWVTETFEDKHEKGIKVYTDIHDEKEQSNIKTRFTLKPIFIVFSVRSGSVAEQAGLRVNDKILKVNKRNTYDLSIEKINELLKSEEGKTIEMEVERDTKIYTCKFKLKSII